VLTSLQGGILSDCAALQKYIGTRRKYIGGKDQSTVGQFTDTIPEDAADLKSVSDTAIQQMLPSSSSALLESSSSHSNLQSSLPFNRAQIEKIETLAAAQKAEGELDAKGSLSDSTNKSSRLLSAEQLWKDAWKAFEQPEQKHGLVASRKLSGLPMREQRSDFEHQNSFPSLTARLFGRRDRSRPQEQRYRPRTHTAFKTFICRLSTVVHPGTSAPSVTQAMSLSWTSFFGTHFLCGDGFSC